MSKIQDLKKIQTISKALGDPYRLRMLELVNNNQGWVQCEEIIAKFDLAQSTISHHMKQLVDADLVFAEKDGRKAKYKVNTKVFKDYIRFLDSFSMEQNSASKT